MLAVPVFDIQGQRRGQMEIDPAWLGGEVRPALLKQAVVTFLDRGRQHSARTKGRGEVEGSTRKLYRQKGTGNARMGNIRTPIRRGGGRAFAKLGPRSVKEFPKKMRRLARANAVLAKIQSDDVMIVDGLNVTAPKTKTLAGLFSALKADRGCLLALDNLDNNVVLSCRNLSYADTATVDNLNAYGVLRRRKLIFTKPAFERFALQVSGRVAEQEGEKA